ncbi:AzlD family protein [Phreatobacter stygius]|uniref:AzlD domain-containing protein n=1 Tax=Phreatobacter stygius TaxID=1940610 RepID=A0A4D7B0M6_9HYPH|nr:AzlD domain-containing protein [Phreatobacter stygius]QCI64348.1 AzlD domain-containing protein [Phreatobacter stygius]
MSVEPTFLPLLLAMALASFACRASGFWLMRFIPITPRLEAALKATPVAVMVGIVVPTAMRGQIPELIALGVVAVAMRLTGNDLIAALAGVATVAAWRVVA